MGSIINAAMNVSLRMKMVVLVNALVVLVCICMGI